jgi:hypothetical protein
VGHGIDNMPESTVPERLSLEVIEVMIVTSLSSESSSIGRLSSNFAGTNGFGHYASPPVGLLLCLGGRKTAVRLILSPLSKP